MDFAASARAVAPTVNHDSVYEVDENLLSGTSKLRNPLSKLIVIREHIAVSGKLQCCYCLKELSQYSTFREHINRRHIKKVLFSCEVADCFYQTFSYTAICDHDRKLHGNARIFSVAVKQQTQTGSHQPVCAGVMAPYYQMPAGGYPWIDVWQNWWAVPSLGQGTISHQPAFLTPPPQCISNLPTHAAESIYGACPSVEPREVEDKKIAPDLIRPEPSQEVVAPYFGGFSASDNVDPLPPPSDR